MGQQEVYDFLKKNKRRWFTSKEITQELDSSLSSITTTLKKLRQYGAIDHKLVDFRLTDYRCGKRNIYQYRFKE